MTRLAPALLEIRTVAAATLAVGLARTVTVLAGGGQEEARGLALGLAGTALVLWTAWAARAARRAIRLALPVRPRWVLEGAGTTVIRVTALTVLPVCALVVVAGELAAGRAPEAPAVAAGALLGVSLTAYLVARRVARAEETLGRRLLREPRPGNPLGRRSFQLEPEVLSDRPSGALAGPWPSHRPPPRVQRSAMELDPANPASRHAVGVTPPGRLRRDPGAGS